MDIFFGIQFWENKQLKNKLQVYVFFLGGQRIWSKCRQMEIGFIRDGSLIYIFDSNIFSTICLISGKTTTHLVYN